mmetsp:Transcript_58069/g.123172  ORF Transcript_58069/g.123172 Transcript_58069/m.123172 type:complete len:104 (-) Transcript_58069:106-417(-)
MMAGGGYLLINLDRASFVGASFSLGMLKISKDSEDLISNMVGLSLGVADQQLPMSFFTFAGQQLSIAGRLPSMKTAISNPATEVIDLNGLANAHSFHRRMPKE